MTEVEVAHFGAELKDGFKPVNAWVSQGIAFLDDVQQFYRERSAIESEYASKLQALARKYFERKAKKSAALSVGENPLVTPGSLESASMSTWATQLTTLEQRAAEHDKFSKQLIGSLAEPLKHLATRYEELRKLHADYAARLEKERDNSYADLRKMKGRYDSVCQDVEKQRKKVDGAFDMSKGKAQASYNQHTAEMNNVKNTYIICINVTNKQKERYYHVYVPELLDSLQDLNETRVASLNNIWLRAASLEKQMLTTSIGYVDHLAAEIPRNNPSLDSLMFARHNAMAQWPEPPDMVFEPSPVWLDDDVLASDEQAKNFLRNVLTKSKGQLAQLKREAEAKRREVEGARRVRQNIRAGTDKRDEVEIVRQIFDLQTSLHETERQRVSAEVEISTITSAVGDVSIGARNHNFKSETFKIPTNCDLCGDRIWGINAKGFICRDCGFTCHSKCEMKCPADCPGELGKEEKKKIKAERQEAAKHSAVSANGTSANGSSTDLSAGTPARTSLHRSDTMNTLSSGYSATAHRSVSGTQSISAATDADETAAAPAKRSSTSAVAGGRRNRIVAPPPAQYITADPEPQSDVGGGAAGSNEPRGKMMYPYTAGGEGEISVMEGQEVVIVEADDGSGWLRVRAGGEIGLVPASYVENLPPPVNTSTRPASTYSNSSSHTASSSTAAAAAAGRKKGPAVAPRRGAKRVKYVEAMYDYEARTDAEHSMKEGDRFVLVSKDSGDGWCEVERGGVTKSVPANYVQEV
ncbi:uncharacterized protein PV09_08156 [Verruconis gallopava]|uniref:Protein BZZ1 n=1 Tax=Verruconis gallopava TaxID=253628 RepID=A0A0D1XDF5_9PEZI|nr:uncharacterized protein PV09_08156 [Verruconis gallopava]KIW00266.1 hypothetical protein PV09_08156 [Verruconis gallopava]